MSKEIFNQTQMLHYPSMQYQTKLKSDSKEEQQQVTQNNIKLNQNEQQIQFECLACKQNVLNDKYIQQGVTYIQSNNFANYNHKSHGNDESRKDIKEREKKFYNNILCSQCEHRFNAKESQLDIFKKLVAFFEDSDSNQKVMHQSSTQNQRDQKKLKIRDLVRLVMHMLNEITGLAKTVHQSFDFLINQNHIQMHSKDLFYSLNNNNNNTYNNNTKLQNYLIENKHRENKQQFYDSPADKEDIISLIQDSGNESDDNAESKGKQKINSFDMQSPFAKQPKRIFKKTTLEAQLQQQMILNKKGKKESDRIQTELQRSKDGVYSFAFTNNTNDMSICDDNQHINKSIDFNEFNSTSLPKSTNVRPNIPSNPINKRYNQISKNISQKGSGNNTLNISINSNNNNDIGANSFFTQHSPSLMMAIAGVQLNSNQSIFDFKSTKQTAQQTINADGPASRKLSLIKQTLQRQNSSFSSNLSTKQQDKQIITQNDQIKDQNQFYVSSNTNQVKRAVSVQNRAASIQNSTVSVQNNAVPVQNSVVFVKKEIKANEETKQQTNRTNSQNRNVQNQQDQEEKEWPAQIIKTNKQIPKVKSDLKNVLPQLPSSSSSNCVNSTNCISQKTSKSHQGSVLELMQFQNQSSSLNMTTVQNEHSINNIPDLSYTDMVINLPSGGSPKTLSQKSAKDIKCIIQTNPSSDFLINNSSQDQNKIIKKQIQNYNNDTNSQNIVQYQQKKYLNQYNNDTNQNQQKKDLNEQNKDQNQYNKDQNQQNNIQNQQNNNESLQNYNSAPPPKTLKYKQNTQLNINNNFNIRQHINNRNENIIDDSAIETSVDKLNKSYFIQKDRYQNYSSNEPASGDTSMVGMKSLNNSVNMTALNRTMISDSLLSQSMMVSSKQYATTPIQEKIIIKSIMRNEYGDTINSGYHQENVGIQNQAKYIVSASWWREWIDYVGFNDTLQSQQQQQQQYLEMTSIKKDRPRKIKNKDLLKGEQLYSFKNTKNIELRDNLLEHYDYEAIPKSLFGYLKMWYGVDYEIIRFLKYDPSQPSDKSVYLDLYPEKTLAYSLPVGIRKRQKNNTQSITTSEHLKNKKENLTTVFYQNKTMPSKGTKYEKLNNNNTSGENESLLSNINEKEQINEEESFHKKLKINNQSLDLGKINVTILENKKNVSSIHQIDEDKAEYSHRSITKEKSKACTIF